MEQYESKRQIYGKSQGLHERTIKKLGIAPNVDWFFMNAVLEGYVSFKDLKDGSINLYDLFVINEAILYKNDYEIVLNDALRKQSEGKVGR